MVHVRERPASLATNQSGELFEIALEATWQSERQHAGGRIVGVGKGVQHAWRHQDERARLCLDDPLFLAQPEGDSSLQQIEDFIPRVPMQKRAWEMRR